MPCTRALAELAATPVQALQGRRLEAEDFDRLFSDDPVRDVLTWMSDSEQVRTRWTGARWNAFRSRCQADFGFDPEKDGDLAAAERLGKREGAWGPVWNRFAESPAPFVGVPELLGKAGPSDLFAQGSSWPQQNEANENALRDALQKLEGPPAAARKKVIELEKKQRRTTRLGLGEARPSASGGRSRALGRFGVGRVERAGRCLHCADGRAVRRGGLEG